MRLLTSRSGVRASLGALSLDLLVYASKAQNREKPRVFSRRPPATPQPAISPARLGQAVGRGPLAFSRPFFPRSRKTAHIWNLLGLGPRNSRWRNSRPHLRALSSAFLRCARMRVSVSVCLCLSVLRSLCCVRVCVCVFVSACFCQRVCVSLCVSVRLCVPVFVLVFSAACCLRCVRQQLFNFIFYPPWLSSCISGLVVEYIVAIDVTRVRFLADAFNAFPTERHG